LVLLLGGLLAASRSAGHGLPTHQMAYSFTDRLGQDTRAYLVDTRSRLHIGLQQAGAAVSVGRWLNADTLLVWLRSAGSADRPALFTVGQGWTHDIDCARLGCTGTPAVTAALPDWASDGQIAPLPSPDGAQVAFMRRVGNTYALRLYVGSADGPAARLTRGVFNLRYAWRP
jgi:hypothetical protein